MELLQVIFVLASYLVFFLPLIFGAPLEDLVEYLPDYGQPPTTQFSGYLDATAGCDTSVNGRHCKLHYWLALAEEDAANKPVVLWLNGGPGSSSLLGFVQELGPLLINATGGLMKNPWSWTKVANVMALEAPVGVGFSYCANQSLGKLCKNTDKYTASSSRAALQSFFKKFPEWSDNDFFITGESYAGVYVPTLAKEIVVNAPEINLRGIAVGDPCTDNTAQTDPMDSLWYGHKYGLVDEAIFDTLWNKCGYRHPNVMAHGGKHLAAAEWNKHLLEKRVEEEAKGLGEESVEKNMRKYAQDLLNDLQFGGVGRIGDATKKECLLAKRKFMLSTSHALSQGWEDLFIDDYSLFAPVTSKEDDEMAAYISRADVRRALHVEEAPIANWPYPRAGFDYTKEYSACNGGASKDAPSMIEFHKFLIPRLDIVWVYNGDTDPCLSYEGTRTAVKRIGMAELDGGSYRPWFYNQTAVDLSVLAEKAPLFGPNLLTRNMGAQLGGEVVDYENGLSFLTVHGSGHMVPQFRPQAALHMLERFVQFKRLSPLMGTNATLANMTGADFRAYMDMWTEFAQSEHYLDKSKTEKYKDFVNANPSSDVEEE